MPAPKDPTASVSYDKKSKTWTYKVVALEVPIFFNDFGDHNHDGLMYSLKRYSNELSDHAELVRHTLAAIRIAREKVTASGGDPTNYSAPIEPASRLRPNIEAFLQELHLNSKDAEVQAHLKPVMALEPEHRAELLRTHPMVRPLVIRARVGDTIQIELENQIKHRHIGMHLIAAGYGASSDGSQVAKNDSSLVAPQEVRTTPYVWKCEAEGVFVFHDIGDPDGDEDGTNAHGLFGALIVEPADTWWTDPEEATWSGPDDMSWARDNAHGLLAVDVHQQPQAVLEQIPGDNKDKCPNGQKPETRCPKYPKEQRSFREFVIFIHDEPENHEPHWLEEVPNPAKNVIFHQQAAEPGNSVHAGGSLMCINYRSEQMEYRERLIHKWTKAGSLERSVLNEDQHHSSWMFGDPATPVFRAYIGDPIRIRLVHAGVKETHVFHLHVYEWHSDPCNPNSPLIDAISISPGCGHTIAPLFGAGNVQTVAGDVIWHCHLYPHFHMGMWGMLRTFDTLQTGQAQDALEPESHDEFTRPTRRIGHYPDGMKINRLEPLPDREPPPAPTKVKPGFPLFIAGQWKQKSPIPPWPSKDRYKRPANEHEYDYREPSWLEINAMQPHARPGELFTSFGHPGQKSTWKDEGSGRREHLVKHPEFSARAHTIAVTNKMMVYNNDGWHDPDGHLFFMPEMQTLHSNEVFNHPGHHGSASNGAASVNKIPVKSERLERELRSPDNVHEPLFFRCQHGEVLELTFENRLRPMKTNAFDLGLPPTDPKSDPPHQVIQELFGKNDFLGECGLHVHLVKFDPICADGASTGWNYISAPSIGKKMVYRWWADEEFGTIFFHDHLFANTRQRHGLYGALLVEPQGSRFHDPWTDKEIVAGAQAVIKLPDGQQFREFCVGIGDWIAAYDRNGVPLQAPEHLGSHDDNGVMVVNYRSAPLKERGPDPSVWFSSKASLGAKGDPETPIFETYAGDPVWLRLIQGSHEEQHSFQIHGLRWNRLRHDEQSPVRNQQTLGISEAFTFKLQGFHADRPGDYLWKFAGIDDTWMGCWGLIRAYDTDLEQARTSNGKPLPKPLSNDVWHHIREARHERNGTSPDPLGIPKPNKVRKYHIVARQSAIEYRQDLTDPFGLYFHAIRMTHPDGREVNLEPHQNQKLEPLILRALKDEHIEITLENGLSVPVESEPFWTAPELELETAKAGKRMVSPYVSIHADMVLSDVRNSDGATVGMNDDQRVAPGQKKTYTWYADHLGPSLLQDMADLRNHRHHGLIGALVVEPVGSIPLAVPDGASTAPADAEESWIGSRATVVDGKKRHEETVLILQDGLRLFRGSKVPPESAKKWDPEDIPGDPLPAGQAVKLGGDKPQKGGAKTKPKNEVNKPDSEDQGQKAFNYRTALLDEAMVDSKQKAELEINGKRADLMKLRAADKISIAEFERREVLLNAKARLEELREGFKVGTIKFEDLENAEEELESRWLLERTTDWFTTPPPTPTFVVPAGSNVKFHLVCAADRPRNHSFTIHGHSWQEYPHRGDLSPVIAAEPAISSGTVRTFSFQANQDTGDYLYRSGITKWAISQGLWGILRVD
jgi:manganese oxidase